MRRLLEWLKSLAWWLEPVEGDHEKHLLAHNTILSAVHGGVPLSWDKEIRPDMVNPIFTAKSIEEAYHAMFPPKPAPETAPKPQVNFEIEYDYTTPAPRKVVVEISAYDDYGPWEFDIVANNLFVQQNKPAKYVSKKSCLRAARRVARELWPGCEIEVVE